MRDFIVTYIEMATDDRIAIFVTADLNQPPVERRREPVTLGIACARGRARSGDEWLLVDSRGRRVPVQTSVLDRWSDGSMRWLLVDFQADVGPEQTARYDLEQVAGSQACLPETPLQVQERDDGFAVHTGVAGFQVPRSGHFLFTRVDVEDRFGLDIKRSGITAEEAIGRLHTLQISGAIVERSGPLRVVVRLDGVLRASGHPPLVDVVARLHFFAGSGSVRVELSVTNPRRARHRHGYWDLGDPGSVYLKDLSILFGLHADAPVMCSAESSEPPALVDHRLEIYQDSSGGENWQSLNHCNRHDQVPQIFRGYRVIAGGVERHGLRATPIVSVGSGPSQVTIAFPHFWQNWPKALEVQNRTIVLRLFPHQFSDVHELQGGERKTHAFTVSFGRDTVSDTRLAWCRSPLVACASRSAYAAAGVWTPLCAGSEEARAGYERLVNAAVEGPAAFVQKREVADEYGWRHFGDIYADHEAVRQPGLVSHYNNQYDAIAGFATRFCQTGDRRWWTAMDELAAHVADIDVYHCVDDRAAFNHGLFWHTSHYLPAYTATHRSHSRHMPVQGGGPSAEHNYTTGLMLHYFLTGSERSREVVIQLARWVINMDDGRKSRFGWIDRGDTGLASATGATDYHGPGRGAGNSINALLDAHRLTGEPRCLAKADRLVTRCIHSSDSPDALNLLDGERKWSYTVFLQVLGKYLEYRAEKGLIDALYRYARAALLQYANWMADKEEPYLDHPERLEFPTETWAAQDIRKAAVFEFAACHELDGVGRERFRRRADDFVNYAVSALHASPTGSLARPIVLLLAYGFQRPMVAEVQDALPAVPPPLGPSRRFVPYKRRVLFKISLFAAIAVAAGAAAALWWTYSQLPQ